VIKLRAASYRYTGPRGQSFESLFQAIDKDHNGSLTYSEFEHAIKKLCPISSAELHIVFSFFDTDGSGTVEWAEFQTALDVDARKASPSRSSSSRQSITAMRSKTPPARRPKSSAGTFGTGSRWARKVKSSSSITARGQQRRRTPERERKSPLKSRRVRKQRVPTAQKFLARPGWSPAGVAIRSPIKAQEQKRKLRMCRGLTRQHWQQRISTSPQGRSKSPGRAKSPGRRTHVPRPVQASPRPPSQPKPAPVPVPVPSPVSSPVPARAKTVPSTNAVDGCRVSAAMADALSTALGTPMSTPIDSEADRLREFRSANAPSAAPKEKQSPVQQVSQQTRDIRAWLSSQPAEPTKKHYLNTTETFRQEHKGTYHAEDAVIPQEAPPLSCGEILDAQLQEALKIASKYGATF